LYGLLIRSGVPYKNVGFLVSSQHTLNISYHFGKIEGWAVAQLFEELRYKPEVRWFD
jgi:hypothetical protein